MAPTPQHSAVLSGHAAVPQTWLVQVATWHVVGAGQSSACVHWTQLPAPSHTPRLHGSVARVFVATQSAPEQAYVVHSVSGGQVQLPPLLLDEALVLAPPVPALELEEPPVPPVPVLALALVLPVLELVVAVMPPVPALELVVLVVPPVPALEPPPADVVVPWELPQPYTEPRSARLPILQIRIGA